ncbi:MAG: hypothetical protein LBQ59_00440 [Candidatus Peribacteria bacterium]|nr:hypothetical protein [Candidatus Peribacteria bacterium]
MLFNSTNFSHLIFKSFACPFIGSSVVVIGSSATGKPSIGSSTTSTTGALLTFKLQAHNSFTSCHNSSFKVTSIL